MYRIRLREPVIFFTAQFPAIEERTREGRCGYQGLFIIFRIRGHPGRIPLRHRVFAVVAPVSPLARMAPVPVPATVTVVEPAVIPVMAVPRIAVEAVMPAPEIVRLEKFTIPLGIPAVSAIAVPRDAVAVVGIIPVAAPVAL